MLHKTKMFDSCLNSMGNLILFNKLMDVYRDK